MEEEIAWPLAWQLPPWRVVAPRQGGRLLAIEAVAHASGQPSVVSHQHWGSLLFILLS